jgi:hypothetical protein
VPCENYVPKFTVYQKEVLSTAAVKVVYDIFSGTTIRAAYGSSLL